MTQSAIWPFHRWLISSLNSPTPVSAIMHAGLVNGGGFLLARFSPLYMKHGYLLLTLFVIGLITSLLGTLWKLMQSDVKRMLACSTIAQMGFMVMQCGLGLFPAAVAHLIWHGMFKAYLFLASGGAAQEKNSGFGCRPQLGAFIGALLCGISGSLGFAYASDKSWMAGDTTLLLLIVAFLSASQFALPILEFKTLKNLPLAVSATSLAGLIYGGSVHLITLFMPPTQPQPLHSLHIAGMIILIFSWGCLLFIRFPKEKGIFQKWMLRGYVGSLNASQPDPATVTAHRNQYQYR